MAMILTLYLISSNVYNAVDAPNGRGFSNIEIWMVGAQFPILLALFEYGFVLYLKKNDENPDINRVHQVQMGIDDSNSNLDAKVKKLDYATMTFSLFFFTTFASLYWIVLLT